MTTDSPDDGRAAVLRRKFLELGTRIGASGLVFNAAGSSGFNLPSVQESPVDHFRGALRAVVEFDKFFGTARVVPIVNEQIGSIRELSRTTRGSDGQQLLRVQADFAMFAGWLHYDQGEHVAAQYWADRALEWSYAAGDSDLTALILYRKAQFAGDLKDSVNAVGLAEASAKMAGPDNRLAAVALCHAAHGYALSGDEPNCARSYDMAHEILANSNVDPASGSAGFDSYCIERQRVRSLTALGSYKAAAEGFEQTITHLPSDFRRDRGVHIARGAQAHAGAQNVEHASALGIQALTIGAQTGSGRIKAELLELDAILGGFDSPVTADFRNAVRNAYREHG